MRLEVEIEPEPKGHLITASIIDQIALAVREERADRGEFVLRAPAKKPGEVAEHKVKWGLWP